MLSKRSPVEAVIESYELVLPAGNFVPVFLHELVSQPGQVGLVVRQGEGGDLQVSLPAVVVQHLLDIRMNVQSVDRDHLRPQSPEDLQPLDNPGTEVHRGEVQALAAHPEHLPPLSGGDWIVRHSVSTCLKVSGKKREFFLLFHPYCIFTLKCCLRLLDVIY